jgi:magnesium transporter
LLTYFRYANGKIEQLEFTPERLAEVEGALHWIDLEQPTPEEASILSEAFHFHPLAIEDCLEDVHHPKLDEYDNYLLAIVHGIRFDAPTEEFVTRELDIFLSATYLVTHHKGPMRSISAVREQCSKGLQNALPKGTGFLLHAILDQMFEHYFPSLDSIEDKIQVLQVECFEKPTTETLAKVFALRKDVMTLRRICLPQREIMHRLSRGDYPGINDKVAIYFRDIYDNLYRIVDAAMQYQDLVQGTMDAYLSSVNNRLNETMKRLTVISALLMPLTVLTGIYGMNFEYMPELHWRYGYFTVLAVMASMSAVLIYWFKKKQWI